MELKLKSTGTSAELATWLKGFKDIMPTLLVEVDPVSQCFIAKSFPQSKQIVKYSKISFDAAGYEMTHILDNAGDPVDWSSFEHKTSDNRIKWGMFENLDKCIDVVNMFSATEHEMIFNFDVCGDVYYFMGTDKTGDTIYQSQQVTFKSMSLTMNIKCAKVSETFMKCDDNTFFNRVCNIGSPSAFSVDSNTLDNLLKISSVFGNDAKDRIKFYSKEVDGQRALYAYDDTQHSFDYLLGYYEDGETEDTAINVFKVNFLKGTKGIKNENLRLVLDTAGSSRILVETDTAKIIIAAAQA